MSDEAEKDVGQEQASEQADLVHGGEKAQVMDPNPPQETDLADTPKEKTGDQARAVSRSKSRDQHRSDSRRDRSRERHHGSRRDRSRDRHHDSRRDRSRDRNDSRRDRRDDRRSHRDDRRHDSRRDRRDDRDDRRRRRRRSSSSDSRSRSRDRRPREKKKATFEISDETKAKMEAMAAAMHAQGGLMGMGMGGGGLMTGGVTSGGNTQNVLRGGDWICHHCAGHNFANRTSCFTCQRPAQTSAAMVVPHGPASQMRPGDWMCPGCGGHNFASRNTCFTCNRGNPTIGGGGADAGGGANSVQLGQPAGALSDPLMTAASMASTQVFSQIGVGAFNSGAASSQMKMGDWMCPKCNGHNFANKTMCFTCKTPKPF